jgi:glycosyltransferase involved in cell wall biosynthesis
VCKPLLFSCDDPGLGGCSRIARGLLQAIAYPGKKIFAAGAGESRVGKALASDDGSAHTSDVDWPISRQDGVPSLHDIRAAARLLAQVDPALLVCHQSQPGGPSLVLQRVARASGIPVISLTHLGKAGDVEPNEATPSRRSVVDRRVFVSQENADRFARQFPRLAAMQGPGTISVIRNGVPAADHMQPDPDARQAAAMAMAGHPADTLLLMAARLSADKGQDIAIRALAEPGMTRNIRLGLAGTGSGTEAQSLRRLARQLGAADRVVLLGHRSDVRKLMRGSDMLLQLGKEEGLPLALLEAMAEGTPVIARAAGGVEAALEGLDATLPDLDDAALVPILARRISELASNRDHHRQMGLALQRRWNEQFSDHRMVNEYAVLISSVLAEHSFRSGKPVSRVRRVASRIDQMKLPLPFDSRRHQLAQRWPVLGRGWAVISETGVVAGQNHEAQLEFPLKAAGAAQVRISIQLRQPMGMPVRRLACTLDGKRHSTHTFLGHRPRWLSFDVDVPADGLVSIGLRTVLKGLPLRAALGYESAGANFAVSAVTVQAILPKSTGHVRAKPSPSRRQS